ncbi:MAG: hypothetical protein EBZ50_15545, partial [Alphaproteobacteria bacterium]|nr:hypothetical protein [Alphaproteobacteria bacterium]
LRPAAIGLGFVVATALATALVWGGTQLFSKPTAVAEGPALPEAPLAPAPFDPVAAIQGEWVWTGLSCGQGSRVTTEMVDGEQTLVFAYQGERFRHKITTSEGRTINTEVISEKLRGATYRLELSEDGQALSIWQGPQTTPDTWEKCP